MRTLAANGADRDDGPAASGRASEAGVGQRVQPLQRMGHSAWLEQFRADAAVLAHEDISAEPEAW